MSAATPKRRVDPFLLAGLAAVAVFLAPARGAAMRGDDTWVSELNGEGELRHISLLAHVRDSADRFIDTGRPSVGGTLQGETTAWLLGDHRVLVHLLLVLLTVAAAGLLYALVRQLGMSRPAGLLVIGLLAGAIQLRSYHDPVLGYWGTTQWVLIVLLGSLILFVRALREGSRRLYWLSVALFVLAPLLYEASYTLCALFLGVALLERRGRAALRAAAPFLAIGAFFVLLSLYLRSVSVSTPEGYEVGGSYLEALRIWVVQLFAPIPASNLFFRADQGAFLPTGTDPTAAELLGATWRGLAVFALVTVVALRLASGDGRRLPEPRTLRALAIVGGLLWTTSVMIISTSPKYQTELVPGRTHLPSLFQVFGWALVAAAAVLALIRSAARRSRAMLVLVTLGCAGALGLGAGMTGFSNMRVVALEVPVTESRGLLERATEDGAFRALPEKSTLVFSNADMAWNTGHWGQVPIALESMLIDHDGRRLDGRIVPQEGGFGCPRSDSFPPQECEPLAPSSAWVRVRPRPDGGTVIVAPIRGGSVAPERQLATRLRVFERQEGGSPKPARVIGATRRGRPWSSDGLAWRRVDGDGDWAIFETAIPAAARVVAGSLNSAGARDFQSLGPPDEIVRIYGTKRLLP